MLKILQTASREVASRLELVLLLALVIAVPGSAATPTLQTLYNFTDLGDGGFPQAGLVLSSSGALYGTTADGAMGWGSIFELTPGTGGTWTFSTLYTFTGGADGAMPLADLAIGANNVLYGTTYYGGTYGYGTVFQLSNSGNSWTEKVLYSFQNGADGANPQSGVTVASNGVLYGNTYNGGTSNMGTIYELIPVKGGGWNEKVLYAFKGNTDGANPVSDMVLGSGGSLFGTTYQGGSVTITNQPPTCTTTSPCTYSNWGTVFELTPKGGGTWVESLLYTFLGGSDGGSPQSALIIGKNNVLYGSASSGGTPTVCPLGGYPLGCGVVFQVAPPAKGTTTWTESVLYTFTGVSPDGVHPNGNMALNSSGALLGTTTAGGIVTDVCYPESYPGCGTIFEIKPPATKGGSWTKSNIMTFNGINGGAPNGVILGNGGTLYGTTYVGGDSTGAGTVFLMTP